MLYIYILLYIVQTFTFGEEIKCKLWSPAACYEITSLLS